MFSLKKMTLHNYSFNRVWPKTIIIVKIAVKNHIGPANQISISIFLDHFHAIIDVFSCVFSIILKNQIFFGRLELKVKL